MRKWILRLLLASGVAMVLAVLAAGWLFARLTVRTEGHYFDSDGLRIHYTDEGSGYPVILVHGIGANADINWRAAGTVSRLARNFRVITFDLRGHGLSGRSSDPDDYGEELVLDITRLMDHLDIEKAHVAGYSLGGFLTLKLLSMHPERVQSAAFCASGWANVQDVDDVLSPYRPPSEEAVQRMRRFAYNTPPYVWGSVSDYIRHYLSDLTLDKPSKRAMKRAYPELAVTEEDLQRITTPCICFMGTADGLVPYASDLKERLPDVEFIVLEGEGHISTAMSGTFKSRLEAFLLEHTPVSVTAAASEAP